MFRKGISEVESKAGCTEPAIKYKERYHSDKKLFEKGKRIA
jgi:hypothetical protein